MMVNLFFLLPCVFYIVLCWSVQAPYQNVTVQLGGTAFLVCEIPLSDRVGVNWVSIIWKQHYQDAYENIVIIAIKLYAKMSFQCILYSAFIPSLSLVYVGRAIHTDF